MSISLKQLKEQDAKIHEKLHENIKLLTFLHPPSKDFEALFKKNMFAKSNKAAFQHVIHYLFTVLNPELTKEKITWPLYDIRLESTFRNEVVSFINQINAQYEHANIANLMSSHLVSPQGFKFVKFMLKLSVLVLYEEAKKSEVMAEMQGPIRTHKDPAITNIITKNLRFRISLEEAEGGDLCTEFNKVYEGAVREAEEVVAEGAQVETDLFNGNKMLKERKQQQDCDQSGEALIPKLNSLEEKMIFLENIKRRCDRGAELLSYLSSDKPLLEFKKSDFFVPDSVRHLFTPDSDKLDLLRLFNSVGVLLENARLEMPVFGLDQLNDLARLVTDLNEKYSQLDQKLAMHRSELVELAEFSFEVEAGDIKNKKVPMIVVTTPTMKSCYS